MKLKRFISVTMATSIIVSLMSVTNIFAAAPTFKVGVPIDAVSGEEVTEFTAGQIIEVPIDIENVDTNKISMAQLQMYYDSNIFEAGIDTTDDSSSAYQDYYNKYAETLFAMDPTDEQAGKYTVVARNNMQGRTKGSISGSVHTANPDKTNMTWTITGASSVSVSDTVPEFYYAFTVKSDYSVPSTLNYQGSSTKGDGLFYLDALYVDETTSINHSNLTGTQTSSKINACNGAFKVSVNPQALAEKENKNLDITRVYAVINGTEYDLEEYEESGSGVYSFPARLITSAADSNVSVNIYAVSGTDTVKVCEDVIIDLNTPTTYQSAN